MNTMESGMLPSVPPGLPWAPGWCFACSTERDVITIGIGTVDGLDVELSACRWCFAKLRDRITAVGRRKAVQTRAGERAHQIAQWSRALCRRRLAGAGRHRSLPRK
ncbi:hypothetical protein [Kitasatospora sp. NPDC094011]|uniref:hypothetical protein n=1 Tax=Kitasatospora sp. NPDC094011 TaxID=3364090 RepID=UPI00380228E0